MAIFLDSNVRNKIALSLYAAVSLGTITTGLIYLFSPRIMPYHEKAIGVDWPRLAAPLQIILLALMKAAGAGMFGLGLAIFLLAMGPLRRGDRWVRLVLPLIGLALHVPLFYVTLTVELNTPGSPPWYLTLLSIVMILAAFAVSPPRHE